MEKDRLIIFSDAVLAIILTIMVLELRPPENEQLSGLMQLWPVFVSYVLSFLYIAIYWNNHHHLLQTACKVNAAIMWSNFHLLFWLSLIPFATAWMGENDFTTWPNFVYGFVLLMAAFAYWLLQKAILVEVGPDSLLARAIGRDYKGKWSPFIYLLGMVMAFVSPVLAGLVYAGMALVWLLPDRRIEERMDQEGEI